MRHRTTWPLLFAVTALTVFSIMVTWPGYPQKYLPDWIDYPEGPLLEIGGREAMRLGLDLKGGTYVLAEADVSALPAGTDVDEAMDGAKSIIEDRINKFGVSETEVTREGKNRLAIQLPGIGPEEAADLIGKTALLRFMEPVTNEEGQILCETSEGTQFPLVTSQPTSGICNESNQFGTVVWTPATGVIDGGTRALTGRQLRGGSAKADISPQGAQVAVELTGEGSRLFEQITGRLQGSFLGIFLDDELISSPVVEQQITGDATVISGLEDLDEAKNLAIQLNAGSLPVPLTTIQTSEVDATLGDETLVKGVQAGIAGILVVMLFMILYYRLPGVLASLALLVYIVLTMMLFKMGPIIGPVTITLSGIAGFVLSVGMAVDANILVFERMKEELRGGRSLASAVEHGFDRAWSSIRDSNISTLITCAILIWFGEQFNADVVRGFAITLAIGVLVSMFSAITVTRTFLRVLIGGGLERHTWLFAPGLRAGVAAQAERSARPFMFDFISRRNLYFAVSALLLVPGLFALIAFGLKPGIEFSSGATMTIDFQDDTISQDQVRDVFADLGHDEARVQKTSDNNFIIRLDELETPPAPPVGSTPPSERDELEAELEAALGPFDVRNFNQVSEIVSDEIVLDAAIAIAFAAIAIIAYISWSFRNVPKSYRYGIAAIIAGGHDVIFVVGAFAIFGKVFGTEVDSMFITGVLTVLGFSVHDTIVTFDRIRENVATNPGVAFDEIVNASLTETFVRSMNTSLTVVFAILALLLLGAGQINVLLIALLLGIVAGTYSSVFIASQILVAWEDGDFSRLMFWRSEDSGEGPAPASA